MKDKIKREDIKNLWTKYTNVYVSLNKYLSLENQFKNKLTIVLKEYTKHQTLLKLKQIPLDNLKSVLPRGVRLGILINHGWSNVYEVYQSSLYTISSYSGLSVTMAQEIKNGAQYIYDREEKFVELNLNYYNRNSYVDNVIKITNTYFIYNSSLKTYQKYLDDFEKLDIIHLLNVCFPAKNVFKWLFISKKGKQNIYNVYLTLNEQHKNFVENINKELSDIIETLKKESVDKAWTNFYDNYDEFVRLIYKTRCNIKINIDTFEINKALKQENDSKKNTSKEDTNQDKIKNVDNIGSPNYKELSVKSFNTSKNEKHVNKDDKLQQIESKDKEVNMGLNKKLEEYEMNLLDFGKRNNLVNFRDTKASTVEIIYPYSNVLFDNLEGESVFEVYDPKIDKTDEYEINLSEKTEIEKPNYTNSVNEKEEYLKKYMNSIRKHQILCYNSYKTPITSLKNIEKKAQGFIQETGVNVAYMAFGFLHYNESDSSDLMLNAPILLVPIYIERSSLINPFVIKANGDEVILNQTLLYELQKLYGINLPEYKDQGLDNYLKEIEQLVTNLQWYVTNECKIGLFSFLKINMYHDLKDNADKILQNDIILRLLGENSENDNIYNNDIKHLDNPLIELHNVIDADSSQIEAIEAAKSGKSFVLQGPPGTGKSQTIINIIAECLSNRKSVLFVSEKLAALNIVYEKLKQANLGDFCLQLHSYKANKKDVIEDICNTLKGNVSEIQYGIDSEIAIKEKTQKQLDTYAYELHKIQPVINLSLYQLYESYAKYKSEIEIIYPIKGIEKKGKDYLIDTISLLDQYVDYIPSIGYNYKTNIWYGYVGQDSSYIKRIQISDEFQKVINFMQDLKSIENQIIKKYKIELKSFNDGLYYQDLFSFLAESKLITSKLLNLSCYEKVKSTLFELEKISKQIISEEVYIDNIFDKKIYEINWIEKQKDFLSLHDGLLTRLFNSKYKNICSIINSCTKDKELIKNFKDIKDIVEKLYQHQKAVDEYLKKEESITNLLGELYIGYKSDWNLINEEKEQIDKLFSNSHGVSFLNSNFDNYDNDRQNFREYHKKLNDLYNPENLLVLKSVSNQFNENIINIYNDSCEVVVDKLSQCLKNINKLENWVQFNNLLLKLNEKEISSYIDLTIKDNIAPNHIVNVFKKLFYYQWIDLIILNNESLSSFNEISQKKAIQTFCEKDKEQFDFNKQIIRKELTAVRKNIMNRIWDKEVSLLLREGEKKRKQKSVRNLLKECGNLIQQIKPCFLMSPLSVSTFLDSSTVNFDVVIFDEASQVFPWDALGAIYRGKQLIVVGDSKQMPPSNFFNATLEYDDDEEAEESVNDFESILDLCKTIMPQYRLSWHYRSRYESLIAFSNKNFYDSNLITFPSAKENENLAGVKYYHVDSIFDRKSHTNFKEAEFIVDLIYKHIDKYPNRTLGVVAFSISQQELIDKLLSKRRNDKPECEFFFNKNQKEPFFIKNLETVQGDERDTIIFSVAYGKDHLGKLLHNFGPLNRVGGERRLNVAITRAKYNVQVVSSMHYTDIDLSKSSSLGVKLLRDYLDYAENGNVALARTLSIKQFDSFDSNFELEVYEFLRSMDIMLIHRLVVQDSG